MITETTTLPNTIHVIRMMPGEDLKVSLQTFADTNNIRAGWIVTAAGSLACFNIRFADQAASSYKNGKHEIISLTGTLSIAGSHLHISVADDAGQMTGGHLLEGNIIYTTAEIVIQCALDISFKRRKDGSTPWKELIIEKC